MPSLFERFRPQTWEQVVGQDAAVRTFRRLATEGAIGGRAYWITGISGAGKTTIARLAARELADPFCIEEVDAGDVDVGWVRDTQRTMHLFGFGVKAGRAFIINEAHRIRADIIGRFNTAFEPIPNHAAFFFTTTIEGAEQLFEDSIEAPMFLSRCLPIKLGQRGILPRAAEMMQANARLAGMDGRELGWYVDRFKARRNNWRAVWQDVEAAALAGSEGVA